MNRMEFLRDLIQQFSHYWAACYQNFKHWWYICLYFYHRTLTLMAMVRYVCKASIKSVVADLFTIRQRRWRLSSALRWSIIRSAILVGSTVVLLVARIKVMSAQLPVFTRWASTHIDSYCFRITFDCYIGHWLFDLMGQHKGTLKQCVEDTGT